MRWTENYSRSMDGSENSLSKTNYKDGKFVSDTITVDINKVQPSNAYNFKNNNIRIGDIRKSNIPLGKYCQRNYMNCQYKGLI